MRAKKGKGKHYNNSEPFPIRITETNGGRETTRTSKRMAGAQRQPRRNGREEGRRINRFLTTRDNGNGGWLRVWRLLRSSQPIEKQLVDGVHDDELQHSIVPTCNLFPFPFCLDTLFPPFFTLIFTLIFFDWVCAVKMGEARVLLGKSGTVFRQ